MLCLDAELKHSTNCFSVIGVDVLTLEGKGELSGLLQNHNGL